MNRNVVIVTNIPRPYRRALFAVLREQLKDEGLDLRTVFTTSQAKFANRGPAAIAMDDEASTYARNLTIRAGYERVVSLPTNLGALLKQLAPACVVTGGLGVDALLSTRWCAAARVPHVVWFGGWPQHEGRISIFQTASRRHLVKKATAYVSYGTAAADYLCSLGATRDRVFFAWNTVDLEGFASIARAAAASRDELRTKYRLAERNLLFVGSLVARKGVNELVESALLTMQRNEQWALHLVGDGPLKPALQKRVGEARREDSFRFHGLLPEKDVAELLGLVDGFVLPSQREAWGLVVNEAMACGVPVIVSPHAGATRDLVQDQVTGFIVEPKDTQAFAAVIQRVMSGDPEVAAVGRAGAAFVREKASLERAAEGFVSAIKHAISA